MPSPYGPKKPISPAHAPAINPCVTGTQKDQRKADDVYQRKLDWQNLAACRNKPSNLFFPDDEQPRNRDQYIYGIAVCLHCPVRQQCLDYAMEWEQDQRWRFGVWGGLTPHERWIHEPEWQSKKKR